MSLLIMNIMIFLKNLTDYKWHLPGNYIVHVIIIAEKILLHGNNTLMLYLLHVLLYRYLIYWHYISCYTDILITHVDVVTATITELSQWSKYMHIK